LRITQKGLVLIILQLLVLLNLPAATSSAVWQLFPSPTGEDLNSVFMVDANDGWAVGAFGTIIHWNGASWSIVTSPTGDTLNSVFTVNSNDAWAVGFSGDIIHWDGTSWKFVTNIDFLSAVFMVSSSDGWAVSISGKITHWDGSKWGTAMSQTGAGLNSVFMVNSGNGWAVGSSGTILHYGTSGPVAVGGEILATNGLATLSGWLVAITAVGIVAVTTLIAKKLRLKSKCRFLVSNRA
jgi:hypothetical protein